MVRSLGQFQEKHTTKGMYKSANVTLIIISSTYMLEWNPLKIKTYEEMSFTSAILVLSEVIQVEGEPLLLSVQTDLQPVLSPDMP